MNCRQTLTETNFRVRRLLLTFVCDVRCGAEGTLTPTLKSLTVRQSLSCCTWTDRHAPPANQARFAPALTSDSDNHDTDLFVILHTHVLDTTPAGMHLPRICPLLFHSTCSRVFAVITSFSSSLEGAGSV